RPEPGALLGGQLHEPRQAPGRLPRTLAVRALEPAGGHPRPAQARTVPRRLREQPLESRAAVSSVTARRREHGDAAVVTPSPKRCRCDAQQPARLAERDPVLRSPHELPQISPFMVLSGAPTI